MADAQDERLNAQPDASLDQDRDAMENRVNPPSGGLPFLGFVGSFTHGVDAKGRMIIPASFREALGDRFAVAPTPDFKAVALYPIRGWIERRDELTALVRMDARVQPLMDQFSKYSYVDCESDAQGRLLLPQKIRAWRLGGAREVDVNGAVTHIRILPAADSKAQDERFDEVFSDPLALIASIQQSHGSN